MPDKTSGDELSSGFFYGLGFWLAGFCTVGAMFIIFVLVLGFGFGQGIVDGRPRPAVEARE